MRNLPRFYARIDRDRFLRALTVESRESGDLRRARDMERCFTDLELEIANLRDENTALRHGED